MSEEDTFLKLKKSTYEQAIEVAREIGIDNLYGDEKGPESQEEFTKKTGWSFGALQSAYFNRYLRGNE